MKDELIEALAKATSLEVRAEGGEITFDDFLRAYKNFYSHYALDGHEAGSDDRRILNELDWAIELHRKVQEEVLNHVYIGGDQDRAYLNSIGRIDPEQAESRLSDLCRELGAKEILRRLSA